MSKTETLRPFKNRIEEWARQGLTVRAVSEELQKFGINVDFNAVYRFARAEGIRFAPKSKPEQSNGTPKLLPPPQPPSGNGTATAPSSIGPTITVRSSVPLTSNFLSSDVVLPPLTPMPQSSRPALVSPNGAPPAEPPAPEKPAPPAPPPVSERFPDLDPHRELIVTCIRGGCLPLETWAILHKAFNVSATLERITEYTEALINELYPVGPTQTRLLEIRQASQEWPNSLPVMSYGDGTAPDTFKLGDCFTGIMIVGGPGCGKTSGSLRTHICELVSKGCCVVMLTTKKGDARILSEIAARYGRGSDFQIVRVDGPLRLNAMQYLMETAKTAHGEAFLSFYRNIVSGISAGAGQSLNDTFWKQTGDQLLRSLLNLCLLAKRPLNLDTLCELVTRAPASLDAVGNNRGRSIPVFGECMAQAEREAKTEADRRVYRGLEQYWLHAYPTLSPETRSCITFAFAAMIDALRDRHVYELLSTNTTITSESIIDGGKIVALDLPVDELGEGARLVQIAFKYLLLRAVLRRADKEHGIKARPIVIIEDECQNFAIDLDAEFQRVAREYRVVRLMATQNINNLFDRFGGGDAARVKVESILGNLNTRIWHANADTATNKYASESIGTADRMIQDTSTTPQTYPGFNPVEWLLHKLFKKPVKSASTRTVREPLIHPHEFQTLRTGGEPDFVTEAILTQVGRTFSTGQPFLRIAFKQVLIPTT